MHKNGVMIVTGSGRGIGAATAIEAARQGYSVCINYEKNFVSANEVAEKIKSLGGKSILVQANVSVEEEVIEMFNKVEAGLGPVTALVNNVGVLHKKMPLSNMSVERITRIVQTNILSAFICSREAVRRMACSGGGCIVNVSSAASRLGAPSEYVDYAASKGAIDTLTIGLSKEVADIGIRVNCVRPGFIYTDIHADGGEPDRVNRLASSLPMKRGGRPEEVAKAILWLTSDEASFVTGSFLDLAGGK